MIGIDKIKVLIVDDSAMVRKMLTEELGKDSAIEVVGAAPDPFVARDMIVELKPDVILLDIEMPRMDGLTFLRKLMKYYPCRVIVVSSLAQSGSEVAMKALEYCALDVVAKPSVAYSVQDMGEQLAEKIKEAAMVPIDRIKSKSIKTAKPLVNMEPKMSLLKTTNKVIAIGASTGGTEAIQVVLQQMPVTSPPIVIVQHMSQYFTKPFAARLNELCGLTVREAEDKEILSPGKVLIAPGNLHMQIKRSGAVYYVSLFNGPMVYHQRPAVDVLFSSVAKVAGKNAIGALLTGMGKDGAQGLLEMKNAGAFTIAQDEKSSIVFGMPREAILMGAAQKVVSLSNIAHEIVQNL